MASDSDGYLVEGRPVNALADVSTARRLASTVEDAEARRLGLPVSKARAHVARRLVPRRGRSKTSAVNG